MHAGTRKKLETRKKKGPGATKNPQKMAALGATNTHKGIDHLNLSTTVLLLDIADLGFVEENGLWLH